MHAATGFTIGTVLLVLAAIPANLYVILYWTRSPWNDSTIGRDAMLLAATLAAVLDVSVATVLFGLDGWPRTVVRILLYIPIVFALFRRLWVLNKVQHDPEGVRAADVERARRRHGRKLDPPHTAP